MTTLHITNGDVAAELLRQIDPEGEVLPWRDALHEGPIPAGLDLATLSGMRALFIAAAGWASYRSAQRMFETRDQQLRNHRAYSEIALWFEWDLYDQLQLLQIVDALVSDGRELEDITLFGFAGYFGEMSAAELERLTDDGVVLDAATAALAVRAWEAVRSPDAAVLVGLVQELAEQECPLPFLPGALARLIEELPSLQNGLARCEHQILQALVAQPMAMNSLFFEAHRRLEDRSFLADTVFATQIERLAVGRSPLVQVTQPVSSPWGSVPDGFWDSIVEVTPIGHQVFYGLADWLEIGATQRWVGGIMIDPKTPAPRWDSIERTVVFPR